MADSVTQRVLEEYPTLAWLLRDKEIGRLLRDAVDPNKGFSAQTFQAKLYQTNWWKRRSQSQREWEILSHTDPGEARQQRAAYAAALKKAAMGYGVRIPNSILQSMARGGLSKGFDPTGPEMMYRFSLLAKKGFAASGARRTAARQAQQTARRDYFYGMSKGNAAKWGDRIARGLATEDDMRQALQDRAMKMYPQFATGLKQGQTMADMTDGYRSIIAEELELDPERIDLSTGRWSKVLGVRDAQGKTRPMTNFEVLQMARQDPRYWRTGKGKQTDAQYTGAILQMFGKRQSMGLGGS
jgi:hypothetical protein